MSKYKPGDVLKALVDFEQARVVKGLNYLITRELDKEYDFVELKTYGWIERKGDLPRSPYTPLRWDNISSADDPKKYKKIGSVSVPENNLFNLSEYWLIQPGVEEFYHNPKDIEELRDYMEYFDNFCKEFEKKNSQ